MRAPGLRDVHDNPQWETDGFEHDSKEGVEGLERLVPEKRRHFGD